MSKIEKISELCLNFFDSELSPKGKPIKGKEWTVFSAFVLESNDSCKNDSKFEVVAIGTGSRCLGLNELSLKGDLVN